MSDSLVIIRSDCHGISVCNYHAVHLLHCIQTYKADEILKLGLKQICCMSRSFAWHQLISGSSMNDYA